MARTRSLDIVHTSCVRSRETPATPSSSYRLDIVSVRLALLLRKIFWRRRLVGVRRMARTARILPILFPASATMVLSIKSTR